MTTIHTSDTLTDAFGDFPASFLQIRRDLVEALTEDPVDAPGSEL